MPFPYADDKMGMGVRYRRYDADQMSVEVH
jgi:hypothetical protein